MKFFRRIIFLFALFIFPAHLMASEFLNTFLHINFGFNYSIYSKSEILDYEEDAYSLIETDSEGTISEKKPSHYNAGIVISVDLVPFKPLIFGSGSQAFKFGLRGGYRWHFLKQNITIDDGENSESEYKGELLSYSYWMVGPVVHYTPFIYRAGIDGAYSSGGGFTFYCLFGQIVNGKLNAYPARRSKDEISMNGGEEMSATNRPDWKTGISGYKIDFGVGAEISICSINLGVNLYYSYIAFKMDDMIYSEADSGLTRELSKKQKLHEINLEIYMGIPVDFFTKLNWF